MLADFLLVLVLGLLAVLGEYYLHANFDYGFDSRRWVLTTRQTSL
jgi:hypothetical protein